MLAQDCFTAANSRHAACGVHQDGAPETYHLSFEGMKKRIVIVDHHESIREMLAVVLKRESQYEIVGEAGTGLKAVQMCAMLQPDMVILDLMLPELSGPEVIRRLHASVPATRVLVYTGTLNRSLIIEALRCQLEGFVDKTDPLSSSRRRSTWWPRAGSDLPHARPFF